MDFGKVNSDDLDSIEFKLPPDDPITQKVLGKEKQTKAFKAYVGCAKWGRPDWVGKIYPPKTKAIDFLRMYGQQFNSIELNSVFYQVPSVEGIKKWKDSVGDDFLFCPKFVNTITHLKRLKNVRDDVDRFLQSMHAFDKKLGPLFLMPHPQTNSKQKDVITAFIEELPKDLPLFLEYRHPDWFTQKDSFDYLLPYNVGTVITDAAGRRDAVHMTLTTPYAFIRFVGNSLHKSDYIRIDDWVQRIKQWKQQGLKGVYFFMHQHEELYSPELAKYLIEQLNAECNLSLKVPKFYTPHKNLLS